MERRWGRGTWFAAWAVVTAAQVAAGVSWRDTPTTALLVMAALQGLKIPLALPRLRDLGQPPDDAMWTAVPLLNAALFVQLLRPPPPADAWERRVRSWSRQLSTFGAARTGARAALASAGAVLPMTLVLGALAAVLAEAASAWLLGCMAEEDTRASTLEVLLALAGALALYTVVQVLRRDRVTRGSWLPSIGLLPVLLGALALWSAPYAGGGLGLILSQLPLLAADLLVWPLAMGLLIGAWVRAALPALGQVPDPDARTGTAVEVAAVWGGRAQAVAVAAQLLYIPGIYLSIIWAFSEVLALLQPARPSFERSAKLATGIYSKLFKMLALWFFATVALDLLVMSPWASMDAILQTLIGIPGLIGPEARIAQAMARLLAGWWYTLALLAVFLERDALMAAHEARLAEG